jgi:hypothetical protein
MIGLTLDAGALIALERSDRAVVKLVARTLEYELPIAIPAGVLAQVWRDGARQVRLARLLNDEAVEVVALDDLAARQAGLLCGRAGTADIVDASVVACALERHHAIATSDPDDLRRLDRHLALIVI